MLGFAALHGIKPQVETMPLSQVRVGAKGLSFCFGFCFVLVHSIEQGTEQVEPQPLLQVRQQAGLFAFSVFCVGGLPLQRVGLHGIKPQVEAMPLSQVRPQAGL